jgi:hypothetical protein
MRVAVNRQLFIRSSAADLTLATDDYYYSSRQVNGSLFRRSVNVDKWLTARVESDF